MIPALALNPPLDTLSWKLSSPFISPLETCTSSRLSRAPAFPITPSRPLPKPFPLARSNDGDLDRASLSPSSSSSSRSPLTKNRRSSPSPSAYAPPVPDQVLVSVTRIEPISSKSAVFPGSDRIASESYCCGIGLLIIEREMFWTYKRERCPLGNSPRKTRNGHEKRRTPHTGYEPIT